MSRIMGTETEHAIYADLSRQAVISRMMLKYRTEIMPEGLEAAPQYGIGLTNGAGFYMDIGEHPEYCTQEVFGPLGATVVEAAGVKVMSSMASGLRQRGFLDDSERILRNVSNGYEAWGYHINMLTTKELGLKIGSEQEKYYSVASPLVGAMVGSMALSGAGRVSEQDGYEYFQKGRLIFDIIGPQTTSYRPLIAPRREPLADPDKFYRLHIVGNDVLHSPWASWLRFGLYDLAVAVSEQRPDVACDFASILPDFGVGNTKAHDIVGSFSKDPIEAAVSSNDGKQRTSIDILEKVLEVAQQLVENGDIDTEGVHRERKLVVDELNFAINELRSEDSSGLDYLVDSRARLKVHERLSDKGYFNNPKQQRAIDFQLDDVEQKAPASKQFQHLLTKAGWQRLAEVYEVQVDSLLASVDKYVTEPYPGRSTRRAARLKDWIVSKPFGWSQWGKHKTEEDKKWQYDGDPNIDAKVFPFWEEEAA